MPWLRSFQVELLDKCMRHADWATFYQHSDAGPSVMIMMMERITMITLSMMLITKKLLTQTFQMAVGNGGERQACLSN